MVTDLIIPNTITEIKDYAFYWCKSLSSVLIPNSVASIGKSAFTSTNLSQVIIPNNVSNIGKGAFLSCPNLMEIFFTSAIKPTIGEDAFGNCHPALEKYVPHTQTYGFGIEYITFGKNSFQYTGLSPKVEWSNNLRAYNATLNVEEIEFNKNAGTHTVIFIAKYSNGVDFEAEIPYTYEITKAPLTLTINNCEREYGNENPQLEFSYTGLKNNETAPIWTKYPTAQTSATHTSPCGKYAISAIGGTTTNYEISQYIPGELTITKRNLTVKANDCSKMYGTENPNFTLSYSGFVNNDNEKSLDEKPIATCDATKTTNVGTYPIYLNGGKSQNYSFKYETGVLTIEQATQEILWDFTITEAKVGDQIELTAKATSGLNVSYIVSDESIAELYISDDKIYLNCLKEGTIRIEANQLGDNNYIAATKIEKTLNIKDVSNITDIFDGDKINVVAIENEIKIIGAKNNDKIEVYSMSGQCVYNGTETTIPVATKGMYIVKVNNTTHKVIL